MDRNIAIKKKAQQLVQKGQIDAALVEFEKLFAQGDKDPYDFIVVADILAKRGSMMESVRRYRQAVEEYTKAELFKNAIAVCKKILRISKEDLLIHRTLGELYAKEGLYSDAIIHYLEFAEGSIRRQEHEPALDVIETVLSLSPDNTELSEKFVEIAMRADQPERGGRELYRRAERVARAGKSAEAAELRDRASTLAPGLQDSGGGDEAPGRKPLQDAGFSARGAGGAGHATAKGKVGGPRTEGGELDLDSMVEPGEGEDAQAPEPGVLRFDAGRSEEETEQVEAEVEEEAFEEERVSAAAETADAVATHAELASEYLSAGNREMAAEEFWKAAELAFFRGDLPRVRMLLSSLLTAIPGHEAALRRLVDITAQAEDHPAEAKARFDLAEVYLAHEEWPLARAEYMRVLELNPSNDRARARVQRLDSLNGDVGVDLDSIDAPKPSASVRVRDDQPQDMDNLVDLEEIIDEFKAGISNTISGEDHESHYDLGMAYMEMGLHDEAIEEFQVASKGGPMELKCLEMIALCYLEKDEPAAAARELDKALQLPGHGPEETISIRYNLGLANERLGNLDRALQHFEEVYLLNVDFLKVATKVREVKARLAGAQGEA